MENNQEINDDTNALLGEEENESNRQGCEPNLPEGVSQSQVQSEPRSSFSRMDGGSFELLAILKNAGLDEKQLCPQSCSLLVPEGLGAELRSRQEIVQKLVEHENSNVVFRKQNYQRSKNRALYGTLILIITLALFGFSLILIPTIVSNIMIPFIPVFLLSVAITALARLFLKSHENYCDTEYKKAKDVVAKVEKIQRGLQSTLQEAKEDIHEKIQQISDDVKDLKKIVQESAVNLMTHKGMFKSTTSAEVSAHNELIPDRDANTSLIDAMPGPSNT